MKPGLFIVGAPKCGTTAWVKYLGEHPQIAFSRIKEPHYFALDLPALREVETEREYEALFSGAGDAAVRGEASVLYLFSKAAAEEIRKYNPDARILLLLRAQEDCLPSWHQQLLYTFQEKIEDFGEAWRLSGQRKPATIPGTCKEPAVLDYKAMGRFHEQVARFVAHFPRSQMHVLRFDEWTRNPRDAYLRVLSFLALEDDGRSDFRPVNEAKRHRSDALGRVLQYPPKWMLLPIKLVKAAFGTESLGLADAITNLNRKGDRKGTNPQLKDEIRVFYRDDNRLLGELVGGEEVRA
jgi:sulfotransferase family protein